MTRKTLIACFSYSGNNQRLAEHLVQACGPGAVLCPVQRAWRYVGLTIAWDLLRHRLPRLKPLAQRAAGYDQVVLVAPIWAGQIANPMRSYVAAERSALKDYSFATLSGGYELPPQGERIAEELRDLIGHPPREVLELRVSDLIADPAERRRVRAVTGRRVTEAEFVRYEPAVRAFVQRLQGGARAAAA